MPKSESIIYSPNQAGEMCNATPQSIRYWCMKHDIPRRGKRWQITESVLDELISYYGERESDESAKEQEEKEEQRGTESFPEPSISERDTIELLQEQVKTLARQLETKDEQIKALIEQNSALTASLADTAKALSASKAFENASKALVPIDSKTPDIGHYSPSDGQQKPSTFLSRLKWLIRG
jgi:sRNA-binding protein